MDTSLFNIGLYTSIEASRLLHTSAISISRWLSGYSRKDSDGDAMYVPPLWAPDVPKQDYNQVQLSFRDLMETRFVNAFREAGLPLQRIRALYIRAQDIVESERPFSTSKFYTDGQKIFFEKIVTKDDLNAMLDLGDYQHVFKSIILPTFKDIEYSDGAPIRWTPQRGAKSIVLDPKRSFGQPILRDSGIPTSTIATVYSGYGNAEDVAEAYLIPIQDVLEAVSFERHLAGI